MEAWGVGAGGVGGGGGECAVVHVGMLVRF